MQNSVTTDTWVMLTPTTTNTSSFVTVAQTEFWIFVFFIIQSEQIMQMRY